MFTGSQVNIACPSVGRAGYKVRSPCNRQLFLRVPRRQRTSPNAHNQNVITTLCRTNS